MRDFHKISLSSTNYLQIQLNFLILIQYILQEKNHRRIPIGESYTLSGLYPNTLYYVWLAARSQRGEGATTPPIQVRTKQYGESLKKNEKNN